ncbi:thioredoxin domain-containing protein [Paeniglutamicibacter sp. ABSL32-1]|uniref:thioredoxin domain-containing protein n=1 Tax=Paeniglutamicibacter quisquiliarum TaxID=2849498 RepID=UPI001C2DD001|nr:thioredoxin domain-containing protein [Paeniglutamicibacter quisquiliarum]MBV1779152.1 thioredoxin domain-containing protein [Paeniglutamicibacter quisquiliarum]
MGQRIASSASAYLRQHAHQPVDWWPYGDEAFALAASRDVPVFLSIGYAACHWCHVMARESFDDPGIAAYLNEHFVPIKVDREEHPAVDGAYMAATQTLTGAGGWPMSVFTLPDGRAIHAGTYFPPVPRPGMPSFMQVLEAVADAWDNRRDALELQAATLADHLGSVAGGQAKMFSLELPLPTAGAGSVLAPVLGTAVRRLAALEDPTGGFGPAPKFPPSAVLDFLLRASLGQGSEAAQATGLASRTLQTMARSALADHVGGGFARYCVDPQWKIPHFEKMLYDNAQLLGLYARAAAQLPDAEAAELCRVSARGIHRWLEEEMRLPGGGFASSLDADTVMPDGSHHEGATYTFSRGEVARILGEPDASDSGPSGQRPGALPGAGNVFWQLWEGAPLPAENAQQASDPAQDVPMTIALSRTPTLAEWPGLEAAFKMLGAERATRVQPGRDEKVVAGWNGLAIASLAEAAVLLREPRMLATATRAAEYLHRVHWVPARGETGAVLHRISHQGRAGTAIAAVLEDYAAVALGFQQLAVASGDRIWFARADDVLSAALEIFLEGGKPQDSAGNDPRVRAMRGGAASAEALDDAVPAATSLLAAALLNRAGRRQLETGGNAAESGSGPGEADLALVRMLLGFVPAIADRAPHGAGSALGVAARFVHGSSTELVVAGGTDSERRAAVRLGVLAGVAQLAGAGAENAAYPAGPKGQLRLYVCRGGICHAPVSDLPALAALFVPGLSRPAPGP